MGGNGNGKRSRDDVGDDVRTYWLSFVDENRPEGQRWLGACVVDVSAAQAEFAKVFLLPQSMPGSEWIKAAVIRAWAVKANPGGAVASVEMPPGIPETKLPRDRLMQIDELRSLGIVREEGE